MRAIYLLAAAPLAALAFPAAQAQAQGWTGEGLTAPSATAQQPGRRGFAPVDPRTLHRDDDDDDDRDHRRHRRFPVVVFGGPFGPSADFDANRSWDADRWNDWWHERPWRSYPRWVRSNQGCAPERMWWGGGAWRCGW